MLRGMVGVRASFVLLVSVSCGSSSPAAPVRDVRLQSETIRATINADGGLSGTATETDTIVVSGASTTVGTLVASGSFTLARQ
jgi:hypothetical protein